jgi:acetyl esterase/lipase
METGMRHGRCSARRAWLAARPIAALCAQVWLVVLCAALPAAAQQRRLGWRDVDAMPSAPADARFAFGSDANQFGELRLPPGEGPFPVAIVIHGGCWLSYSASQRNTSPLSDALRRAGVATWNIEYRRVDQPGGGWPGTFRDVAAGADYVRELAKRFPLDTLRVVAVGHSAGGHLALWLGARHKVPVNSDVGSFAPLRLAGVISLGGPPDIAGFAGLDARICGAPVIALLMGGTPAERPERYRQGSPAELLPLGVAQRLIVGEQDGVVPADAARAWQGKAAVAGDDARYTAIPGAGHFEVIAPGTEAWTTVERVILELLRPRATR